MITIKGRGPAKEIAWRDGMTVADLLRELDDPYPFAVVRLNGRAITQPNFHQTNIPDQAEILLIPLIAGG